MKLGRQSKIIELVEKYQIETQEELADLLLSEGYQVTQATVSRDIRELKLTKVQTPEGGQRYASLRNSGEGVYEKYIRVLQDGFLSMDYAQNILVVKTISGMAMAVAAALDHLDIPGMVGCIAGDDTVMCAVRSTEKTPEVIALIRTFLNRK